MENLTRTRSSRSVAALTCCQHRRGRGARGITRVPRRASFSMTKLLGDMPLITTNTHRAHIHFKIATPPTSRSDLDSLPPTLDAHRHRCHSDHQPRARQALMARRQPPPPQRQPKPTRRSTRSLTDTRSRTGIPLRSQFSCSEVCLMPTRWASGSTTGLSTTTAHPHPSPRWLVRCGCFSFSLPGRSREPRSRLVASAMWRTRKSSRTSSIPASASPTSSGSCSKAAKHQCLRLRAPSEKSSSARMRASSLSRLSLAASVSSRRLRSSCRTSDCSTSGLTLTVKTFSEIQPSKEVDFQPKKNEPGLPFLVSSYFFPLLRQYLPGFRNGCEPGLGCHGPSRHHCRGRRRLILCAVGRHIDCITYHRVSFFSFIYMRILDLLAQIPNIIIGAICILYFAWSYFLLPDRDFPLRYPPHPLSSLVDCSWLDAILNFFTQTYRCLSGHLYTQSGEEYIWMKMIEGDRHRRKCSCRSARHLDGFRKNEFEDSIFCGNDFRFGVLITWWLVLHGGRAYAQNKRDGLERICDLMFSIRNGYVTYLKRQICNWRLIILKQWTMKLKFKTKNHKKKTPFFDNHLPFSLSIFSHLNGFILPRTTLELIWG
jgi:hypothetical protein